MTILDDGIGEIEDPLDVRLTKAGEAVRYLYRRLLPRVLKVDAYADHEEIFRLAKLIQAGRRTSPEAARLARRLGLGSPRYLPRRRT